MKKSDLLLSLIFLASPIAFGALRPHGGAPPAHTKSVFPNYSARPMNPTFHGKPPARASVPVKQDINGNRVTDDHLHRVEFAGQRASTVMRNDPHVANHVSYHSAAFVSTLHPVYQQKSVLINEHFQHYRTFIVDHPAVWQRWHAHHFYGGFYYGFHPVSDIQIYFYNPMVHWFYIGTWDEQYYRTWYAGEYAAYPQLNHPFEYYGVYYPTDNLRQLLFGLSAMPVERQAVFRTEVSSFTQDLTQQLANQLKTHVTLSKGDVVITHYEILGSDEAVEVEGFVNFQNKSHNFKGMINLLSSDHASPNRTQVFVATSSAEGPTDPQLKALDSLNASIDQVRGEALPDPVVIAPSAPPAPQPSGEVSADPK